MPEKPRRIYLASASPRRRELLKQINISYDVLLLRALPPRTDVDETPLPGEAPESYVARVASAKAQMGWARVVERGLPEYPVLGADTTVSLDGEILGKPNDREDAEAMLRRLSGTRHLVYTAVAMAQGQQVEQRLSASLVAFKSLSEREIKNYVATGEPYDKAGGYGVQGRAAAFISRVEGSYSGIMGLPLFETVELLEQFGVSIL